MTKLCQVNFCLSNCKISSINFYNYRVEFTTIYDTPISIIAFILGILFVAGSIQNAIALAKLGE